MVCALSDLRIHIISTLIVSPWYSPYMGHVWWVPGHTWPCIPQLTDTQDRSTGNSNYRWQIFLLYINLWCISYSCTVFLHMEENDEDVQTYGGNHYHTNGPTSTYQRWPPTVHEATVLQLVIDAGDIASCMWHHRYLRVSIYGGTGGGKEACSYDA